MPKPSPVQLNFFVYSLCTLQHKLSFPFSHPRPHADVTFHISRLFKFSFDTIFRNIVGMDRIGFRRETFSLYVRDARETKLYLFI